MALLSAHSDHCSRFGDSGACALGSLAYGLIVRFTSDPIDNSLMNQEYLFRGYVMLLYRHQVGPTLCNPKPSRCCASGRRTIVDRIRPAIGLLNWAEPAQAIASKTVSIALALINSILVIQIIRTRLESSWRFFSMDDSAALLVPGLNPQRARACIWNSEGSNWLWTCRSAVWKSIMPTSRPLNI
jgi:hypothetical protein